MSSPSVAGIPLPDPTSPPGTRDRLIAAMAEALRRRGLHGIGLNELLADAQAPKGVLYHHFPGGKTALAVAAIEHTTAQIVGWLGRLSGASHPSILSTPGRSSATAAGDPTVLLAGLQRWLQNAEGQLSGSGFDRGCPLATVALESTGADVELRKALADAFAAIRRELTSALTAHGLPAGRAAGLATLIVAAYEGALMQSRVAGDAQPMRDAAATLLSMIDVELRGLVGAETPRS